MRTTSTHKSREVRDEINPFDDPFISGPQRSHQDSYPIQTRVLPSSYTNTSQYRTTTEPTKVNVDFYNQYATELPTVPMDRSKTHQDILALFDKFGTPQNYTQDYPREEQRYEPQQEQYYDNYQPQYQEEQPIQLQPLYTQPQEVYQQPTQDGMSDEDYATMLQEHYNQEDRQKIDFGLSDDFKNKIKQQEREKELARRQKERQIEEDRKLAMRLQEEEESRRTGSTRPTRTSPVAPIIPTTSATASHSTTHPNTPKVFVLHIEFSRAYSASVTITDKQLEQVMYRAVIRAPYGTTIISDRRNRPIYRISREVGHIHPTYIVENSREEIGQCTQRFKPLSIDKKFNYKRLDTAQVLKMTGNYNGDWVIKKAGRVVATLVKKSTGFYEVTSQSDVFHVLAEVLIMLEHQIRERNN